LEEAIGYCRSGLKPAVSSVCLHCGEEPVISGEKGICNVFFAHCNLQCIFCQNHQISRNSIPVMPYEYEIETITNKIISILDSAGTDMLGFVSPTHFACQMIDIIKNLHHQHRYPIIVYNSNGYDEPETLEQIADFVDVYLPDLKYADNKLAQQLSDVPDYFERASAAIRIMYQQKGYKLKTDKFGLARNGLIIRHLVLPGRIENSKNVLKSIVKIHPDIHVSLMAQYYPPFHIPFPELNRTLYKHEYEEIVCFMEELGIENGWIQELNSAENYQPNFENEQPFL
jgi:putative pyruvate formate lyase activating enzyme